MSAAIRAGRAFVELFLKDAQLQAGLNQAKVKMQAWKASAQAMGVSMLGLGVAMVTPFAMATKAAGDMAETMSKLKVMFGEGFGDVDIWLDKFSASVGRSKKESADALGAFQAMFVGMGIGTNEAAALAKEMTTLAVDFGSFHNVSDPESIERFISAFAGSSQVLDMFGINIKQSNLDLKLLEMGFQTTMQGATELQKILARAEIIRETMGAQGAIGDAIRTADSFSNTYKRVRAEVIGAMISIGETVMPIFRDLMAWFSQGLKSVMAWANENKKLVKFALEAAVAIGAVGGALLAFAGLAGAILAVWKALTLTWAALKMFHLMLLVPVTPMGFALKGLAVAATLAYAAFSMFADSIGEVTYAMKEQAAANEKVRSDDELRMQRLQQLADKQTLSNTESEEAARLAAMLQGSYGNLGITIDSVTGKIGGMTEAQKKLSAAMRAQQMTDLQNQINEARGNLDILNAERNSWDTGSWNEVSSSQGTVETNRRRIASERMKETNRMTSLQTQLDNMKAADANGPADLSAAEVEKRMEAERKKQDEEKKANEGRVKTGEDAGKDLAKIEDDRRREGLTKLDRDIEDAQRRGEERIGLINSIMAGEQSREGGPRPAIAEEMFGRLNAVPAEVNAEIAEIRKKAAEEEAKKAAEATAGQRDEIARKELDLKFAARAGETQEQTAKREHDKRMAMIELEQEQALRNAKEGLDPELIKKSFDADRALAEAEFGARTIGKSEQKIETLGSFSAAAIGRFAAGKIEDQQLAEAKKTNELLARIEKKEGGLPVVGDNE